MTPLPASAPHRTKPRLVVVGPCASGKSTLVAGLRRLGVDAIVCGQEHSDIATLWRRKEPDLVVALEIDLATLRARRDPAWPEWLYEVQRRRLAAATSAAAVRLDTSRLDADSVLHRVVQCLIFPRPIGFDPPSSADRRPSSALG